MLNKTPCQFLPLRLFMGLQMLGWGVLVHFSNPWNLGDFWDSGWMWSALLVAGGLWVTIVCLVDIYLGRSWKGFGTAWKRRLHYSLDKFVALGYFFAGSVWGAVGTHTLLDSRFQAVDFICPMYMFFFLYLAFKDACKKRERAVFKNETRKATADLFSSGVGAVSRVPAERISG
jgi:hypothetical protein